MRKFGPMRSENVPYYKKPCPVCNKPFKEGDYSTLVILGPDSEEEKQKAREGRPYNSVCSMVHWDCSTYAYQVENNGK